MLHPCTSRGNLMKSAAPSPEPHTPKLSLTLKPKLTGRLLQRHRCSADGSWQVVKSRICPLPAKFAEGFSV